jgi:NAD(P)-dependent dehydrogenase (short-subunit alcohol dehydrogenase family)
MKLSGKAALVTGGSQGIGAAIAERLAAEGVSTAVLASASMAKAQVVVDRIRAKGGKAEPFVADVVDGGQVTRLVREAEAKLGPIDILVNSAGVYYATPVGDTDEAAYDRMMDINLKGTWNAINAVAPGMKARKRGKIINISSVAGVMGIGTNAVYCASKAGVIMMTRALANELAPHGINVNCISPGNTETPMNHEVRTNPALKHFLDAMTARTPSGRVYSTAEEIANVTLFLVSDETRAMHGSNVLIDEGFSAGL